MHRIKYVESGYVLIEILIIISLVLLIVSSNYNCLVRRKKHLHLLQECIFQNDEYNLEREVLLESVNSFYYEDKFENEEKFLEFINNVDIQYNKSFVEVIDDEIYLHLATNNINEIVEKVKIEIVDNKLYFKNI